MSVPSPCIIAKVAAAPAEIMQLANKIAQVTNTGLWIVTAAGQEIVFIVTNLLMF